MKTVLFLLMICAVALCPGCGNAVVKPSNANSSSSDMPKDGNYEGKGKVTKVDLQMVSVELDHEEVVGLMPAMRMEFYVSDKALLDGLSVGDMVDFTLLYRGGTETITHIVKTK